MIGAYLQDLGWSLSLDGETAILPHDSAAVVGSEARHLKELLMLSGVTGESCCIAVNATATGDQLGRLLADCLAEGVNVSGFVDAAALAAASLGLQGSGLVVELQKHGAIASRMIGSDELHRRAAMLRFEGCGWSDLRRASLQAVADAVIRQTRFDPLHEASDEMALEKKLAGWLQEATSQGEVRVQLMALGKPVEITLALDVFVKATEPSLRQLRRLLRDIRLLGIEQYHLIPESLAAVPGIQAMFLSLGHSPVFVLPEGLVARAAARVKLPDRPADMVMLSRQVSLPPFAPPRALQSKGIAPYRKPTHVLYENRVWSLAGSVSVGRAEGSSILLATGLAGVSRRHCTMVTEGDECVLIDHGRYGTWINEERVPGRQRLSAGDRIRIGDPGVELSLITVSDDDQASR